MVSEGEDAALGLGISNCRTAHIKGMLSCTLDSVHSSMFSDTKAIRDSLSSNRVWTYQYDTSICIMDKARGIRTKRSQAGENDEKLLRNFLHFAKSVFDFCLSLASAAQQK